jgi:hypothetical protein
VHVDVIDGFHSDCWSVIAAVGINREGGPSVPDVHL